MCVLQYLPQHDVLPRPDKATNETEIKVPKGSTRYDWGITRMASFSNVNGNNDDRELTLSEKKYCDYDHFR